ncbi:MAG: peptide chain release factor 1 [Gammaproteobacteria bacterium]|nr:peptide chain release factor 1 [Gammaproteobacteria bacterium]
MKTLSPSLVKKLETLLARMKEINESLENADHTEQDKITKLSKERAHLHKVTDLYTIYLDKLANIENLKQILSDPEMKALAEEEIGDEVQAIEGLIDEIFCALIPEDPDNDKNVYLEVRAGTGGDEAALFSQNLFDMYQAYAHQNNWRIEIVQQNKTGQGGLKEIIALISGREVYAKLKFESGVHRVQRVPATESQGRVHTSACTVAILPEVTSVTEIDIDPSDLRIDTFRSSGAGGQHVNTTDSAVRITHIPTGVVVECQDERSQHKNKAKAMKLLQSRILQSEREKQQLAQASERKIQVGSGDRSERIRTYNFPQGRITDHRINLTLYQLNEVLSGQLDQLINALTAENQAKLLTAMEKDT